MNETQDSARQRTVIILGGTGYVGDHIRYRMLNAGHHVRLLQRSNSRTAELQADGFEVVYGDVLDPQSLVRAFTGVDSVINLVAIIKESGSEVTFEKINYQGSVNIADAAREASVSRLIQMSALGAGNLPDFPYHFTKWRAENYIRDLDLDWTIVRPSIIFGPSLSGQVQFVTQLADVVRQAPLTPVIGNGKTAFQPIHVEDVASAYLRILEDPGTIRKLLELAGPDILTYEQMLDEIAKTLAASRRKIHIPVPLVRLGVSALDILPFLDPPVTADQLKMLQIDNTTTANIAPDLVDQPLIPFVGNLDYIR